MTYTSEDIEQLLTEELGEMIVVLESDSEYELHVHDTEFNHSTNEITTYGMSDSEYTYIRFKADSVEQIKWHEVN